jgi:indole-3-glycerol phosphate synthase
MNILEKIVQTKIEEVAFAKTKVPLAILIDEPLYHTRGNSFVQRIKDDSITPVIAEFKRRSPSKGWINENAKPENVVAGYAEGNAAAISVLTDKEYFGGSLDDLLAARETVSIPLLRKDFTIDAYQLHEAKAFGADIILLIAAILSPAQVHELAEEAQSIGLEVLLEIHDESELNHVSPAVNMVGINNRNLKTFEVDIQQSIRLQHMLPDHLIRVAESGIHSADIAATLLKSGFDVLLMGEYFMKQPDPALAFATFVSELKLLNESFK